MGETIGKRAQRLAGDLTKYAGLRVLVVGDIMLDRFRRGVITGFSKERPLDYIAREEKIEERLGGAANVAHNLRRATVGSKHEAIGGKVWLVGLNDESENSSKVEELCEKYGIGLVRAKSKIPIPVKERSFVRSDGKYVPVPPRWDCEEPTETMMEGIEDVKERSDRILGKVCEALELKEDRRPQAVILSDYTKGTLTAEVISGVADMASEKGILVVADPKHYKEERDMAYYGYSWLCPSDVDARQMTGIRDDSGIEPKRLLERLVDRFKPKNALITLGKNGIILFENGTVNHVEAPEAKAVDITGAGDTVKAYFTASMLTGLNAVDSAFVATRAAKVSVEKIDTHAVELTAVMDALYDK